MCKLFSQKTNEQKKKDKPEKLHEASPVIPTSGVEVQRLRKSPMENKDVLPSKIPPNESASTEPSWRAFVTGGVSRGSGILQYNSSTQLDTQSGSLQTASSGSVSDMHGISSENSNSDFSKLEGNNIVEANKKINDIISLYETKVSSLECKQGDIKEAIDKFKALINKIKSDWLPKFNKNIANSKDEKRIQDKILKFNLGLDTYFRRNIMSIFNVAILKRSYNHAKARGNNPLLNNKKPKLAQFLERDDAIAESSSVLETPFGQVNVKILQKHIKYGNQVRLITTNNYEDGPKYTDISDKLDSYYASNTKETLKMLKAILGYLETSANSSDNVHSALTKINTITKIDRSLMPGADNKTRECAAALCGILLVCESGQDRSENGGKRERGIIRTLIRMVESNISKTPFADAFGRLNEVGQVIEGFYTPAARAVIDKTYSRVRTIKQGGKVRGKIVVGKEDSIKVAPPIDSDTLKNDEMNTGMLDLSSDSE